jgi:hypothetical protein
MPGKYYGYYTAVADRIVPYLQGRKIAIEQRFPRTKNIVFRRHSSASGGDSWIRVEDREDLIDWAYQYAEGFHAHIRSDDRGAWFVIDIDSRRLPSKMARLAAAHAVDILTEQSLSPLVKFSGSDGYHLMWDTPDLDGLTDRELWELEREVVRAVACEVERRLADDPAAAPIREAVGPGRLFITTGSADRENPNALLFDQFILKDNANFRVPYSVHPKTGLVAVPIPRERLESFRPEDATPEAVASAWPDVPLPSHSISDFRRALESWHGDGC